MNQYNSNVEGAQNRNIHQDVAKVLAGNDSAIDTNDEGPFPVQGNVLENAAQISQFHFE